MGRETGKVSIADEKLTVTDQMSLQRADRSRFADHQPELIVGIDDQSNVPRKRGALP